jgi:oxygen-independent coproporphyrinogen-3 oxidase
MRCHLVSKVKTIFLGGGTPSILSQELLGALMQRIRDLFDVETNAEITIEANPATLDEETCLFLKNIGFNRMSIGAQSTYVTELVCLGRMHEWEQIPALCYAARKAGFSNLSVDLIYGIPGQTLHSWNDSLKLIYALTPEHLSVYELTPEPNTRLAQQLSGGLLELPSEDTVADMFMLADSLLKERFYEHYEISNYAKPGYRCSHNMAYWQRKPYVGIGAAAHSFDGRYRSRNIASVKDYIAYIEQGMVPTAEKKELSCDEQMQERIFLGLRTIDGIAAADFDPILWETIQKTLQIEHLQGCVEISPECIRLTASGWLISNYLIASILSDIEKLHPEQ